MNHIGDLGGIANDAGLGFLLTQCSILKEDMLRLNGKLFGHRYLMDLITPGGVTVDLDVDGIQALSKEIKTLSKETEALLKCYTHHEGLQERISTTGMVSTEWAKKFGMLGLPARASGVPIDWRTKFRPAPYDHISTRIRGETIGDIAARVSVRFQEIKKSLRIMDEILTTLPEGTLQESLPAQQAFSSIGLGCVEGWRGPVFFAIGYESKDLIRWAHVHDPSWQNWPVLEKAILANIVPDFPLVNKSFNLSYSGHDG